MAGIENAAGGSNDLQALAREVERGSRDAYGAGVCSKAKALEPESRRRLRDEPLLMASCGAADDATTAPAITGVPGRPPFLANPACHYPKRL